jgi:gas vesicle protein
MNERITEYARVQTMLDAMHNTTGSLIDQGLRISDQDPFLFYDTADEFGQPTNETAKILTRLGQDIKHLINQAKEAVHNDCHSSSPRGVTPGIGEYGA